jgi:hypothetical protein
MNCTLFSLRSALAGLLMAAVMLIATPPQRAEAAAGGYEFAWAEISVSPPGFVVPAHFDHNIEVHAPAYTSFTIRVVGQSKSGNPAPVLDAIFWTYGYEVMSVEQDPNDYTRATVTVAGDVTTMGSAVWVRGHVESRQGDPKYCELPIVVHAITPE